MTEVRVDEMSDAVEILRQSEISFKKSQQCEKYDAKITS